MWNLEDFKQNAEAFFENNAFLLWALLLLFFIVTWLLLAVWRIKAAIKKRKETRAEIEKSLQFALPSQENTFVRARLSTALRVPEENSSAQGGEIPFEELPNLSHAKELLAKVKSAPLAGAERLETEELSKTLHFFLKKETWGLEDLQMLNDAFSRILKLSAKYSV